MNLRWRKELQKINHKVEYSVDEQKNEDVQESYIIHPVRPQFFSEE